MPTLIHDHEWIDRHNEMKKIFEVVNETFPSSFTDSTLQNGLKGYVGMGFHCGMRNAKDINFWTGIKRHPEDGNWYHLYDPFADLSDINLKVPSETHNCVYNLGGKPITNGCTEAWACGICRVSQTMILYLKGLCKADYEVYDKQFYIYGLKNNRPYFRYRIVYTFCIKITIELNNFHIYTITEVWKKVIYFLNVQKHMNVILEHGFCNLYLTQIRLWN